VTAPNLISDQTCSWNQPVLSNEDNVSCSWKQWRTLTGLRFKRQNIPPIRSWTFKPPRTSSVNESNFVSDSNDKCELETG